MENDTENCLTSTAIKAAKILCVERWLWEGWFVWRCVLDRKAGACVDTLDVMGLFNRLGV